MAEVLVALKAPKFRGVALNLGVSERTLRSWLREGVPIGVHQLNSLVTPSTLLQLHPRLSFLFYDAHETKGSVDRSWSSDNFEQLLAVVRRGETPAHPPVQPEVASVRLDELGLRFDGTPPDAWLGLLPGRGLDDGVFRIERSRFDFVPFADGRRRWAYTWNLKTNGVQVARLSRGRKHGSRSDECVVTIRGAAFDRELHALVAEFIRPWVSPFRIDIASAHVALDVRCDFSRVLPVYVGRGHEFDLRHAGLGCSAAPTYRRQGSSRTQIASYDIVAKERSDVGFDIWRVRDEIPVDLTEGHKRGLALAGPAARFEVRLRELVDQGLNTRDGLLNALPGLFSDKYRLVDLEAAKADASALEWVGVKLIAESGHNPALVPAIVPWPGGRNRLPGPGSGVILRALLNAGYRGDRARDIARRWHDAATGYLERLVTPTRFLPTWRVKCAEAAQC